MLKYLTLGLQLLGAHLQDADPAVYTLIEKARDPELSYTTQTMHCETD
jgi:hypothetical protein